MNSPRDEGILERYQFEKDCSNYINFAERTMCIGEPGARVCDNELFVDL